MAPARPSEVRALVVVLLVSAAGALMGALAPMSDAAPVALNAALAAVAGGLAVLIWFSAKPVWLHVSLIAVVAGIASIIVAAATAVGAVGTAVGLVWVPIYAGFFFRRQIALAYTLLVALSLAAAFLINPVPGAAHVWLLVVLTTSAAAEAIGSLVRRLHEQATTDPLTGLLNREGLRRAAERELAKVATRGCSLTVVVVDLDGFKLVNDLHGHSAGDQLLSDLAAAWRSAVRADDVLARYGGDEFVLLLPDTDLASADTMMNRLAQVSPSSWTYGAAAHHPGAHLSTLLAEADADLYAKKIRRPAAATGTAGRTSSALPSVARGGRT